MAEQSAMPRAYWPLVKGRDWNRLTVITQILQFWPNDWVGTEWTHFGHTPEIVVFQLVWLKIIETKRAGRRN